MDFVNFFASMAIAVVIYMNVKPVYMHPCHTKEITTSPNVGTSAPTTIQSVLFREVGRAYTSFTIAFENLEERLGLFEFQQFQPECTPEYYRLSDRYRLTLMKTQPQDLFQTHIDSLEFYISLASWVIDNEDLYPGHRSLIPEFDTAYRDLVNVIAELETFMTYNNFVNGSNLTPPECEPTAPSPMEVREFERYSRALVILADVRKILLSVMLDVSVCLSNPDIFVNSPFVTGYPTTDVPTPFVF